MQNDVIIRDIEEIIAREIDWSRFDNKTVLLTGPYGMLASYVVYTLKYLHEKLNINVKLVMLGRSRSKFVQRFGIDAISDWFVFIENDLLSEIWIDGEIDFIVHAASLASPQYYDVCPVDVLSPNVIGNYNLLQFARQKKLESYLLFSTCDIYGSVDGIVSESDYGIMDTLDIHNCYSESKRMAETMCMAFYKQYKIPVKIARIWHTYAPTMDVMNDPRVFASFVKDILFNRDIEIKSDGTGKRSFCYITDAVAGYFKILLDGEKGEAYNVCNSKMFMSISELADSLVSIYPERGLKVIKKTRLQSEHYTENILLKGRSAIPSSKKLEALNWYSSVDVFDGFRRVIEYHSSDLGLKK